MKMIRSSSSCVAANAQVIVMCHVLPDEDDPILADGGRARRAYVATPERDQDLVHRSPGRRTPKRSDKRVSFVESDDDDPLPP